MILASKWAMIGPKIGFNVISESSFPPWYQKNMPKLSKNTLLTNFKTALTLDTDTRMDSGCQRGEKLTKNLNVKFIIEHT